MDRLQILKDYVERKNNSKKINLNNLRWAYYIFLPDIQEVIKLQAFIHQNNLPHFNDDKNPNRHKIIFNYVEINRAIEMRRLVPAYCQDYKFQINGQGKYILVDYDGCAIELTPEAEIENLRVFCEEFPKYRDRFFEYVESFQTKEV